jgi:hypothetical protein
MPIVLCSSRITTTNKNFAKKHNVSQNSYLLWKSKNEEDINLYKNAVNMRINYIAVVKDNVKKQLRTRALTKNATLQEYLTKKLNYEINFKCFSFDGCTNPSWKLKKEFYVRSFFENIFRDLSSFSPCCHYHLTCTIISFLDVSATEYGGLPCMCILVNNFF